MGGISVGPKNTSDPDITHVVAGNSAARNSNSNVIPEDNSETIVIVSFKLPIIIERGKRGELIV